MNLATPKCKHPATFSPEVLAVIAKHAYGRVLDPFSGEGNIHDIRAMTDRVTFTIALEIEWEGACMRADSVRGDAFVLPFPDHVIDTVATSPTWGNRFGDHHNAKDGSPRFGYKWWVGHDLHPANTGALQWGKRYRDVHVQALIEFVRVLRRPSGLLILDIGDHPRNKVRVPVVAWYLNTMQALGYDVLSIVEVPRKGHGFGANKATRPETQSVIVASVPCK